MKFAPCAILVVGLLAGVPSVRLLFKNGDRLTGALSQETIDVSTKSGVVRVKAADVTRIAYAHARNRRDTVILANGDRISGSIDGAALSLTTSAGETVRIDTSTLAGLESTR